MDDKNKTTAKEIMKRHMPDLSYVNPPTETAASKMVKNLRTTGTKAAKKPNKS